METTKPIDHPHKTLLTPKTLAEAIGASESSLRRWVDGGSIRINRTAGGHRRIPLEEAIRFIRESGSIVVRPEILGLGEELLDPAIVQSSLASEPLASQDQLFTALINGDRRLAKGLIVSWYLKGQSLAAIFDGPMRSALSRVGELWAHEERGILIEHRATEICVDALLELRRMLPPAERSAPLALGGSPGGDLYQIPSMMASMILSEAGFRVVNYGANTPLQLLARAVDEHNASLVWVSLSSSLPDVRQVRQLLVDLAAHLQTCRATLVVGGRHGAEAFPRGVPNAQLCGSMVELSALARGMLSQQ